MPMDVSDSPLELDVPPEAEEADEAVEMVRLWIGDGASIVTLRLGVLGEEPYAWGALIADLLRHVVEGISQNSGANPEEVLTAVEEGFRMRTAEEPAMAGRLMGRRN